MENLNPCPPDPGSRSSPGSLHGRPLVKYFMHRVHMYAQYRLGSNGEASWSTCTGICGLEWLKAPTKNAFFDHIFFITLDADMLFVQMSRHFMPTNNCYGFGE